MREIGKSCKTIDMFPNKVHFPIRRGSPDYKTKVGAFFSLILIVSVFAFGVVKVVKLLTRENPELSTTLMEDFYDEDFVY